MQNEYSSQNKIPRRSFFQQVSTGIQGAALTWLLQQDLYADSKPHSETPTLGPHHKARAKSVIHLFMNGGPSQMDLFDPKPLLDKFHGKEHFDKIAGEAADQYQSGI